MIKLLVTLGLILLVFLSGVQTGWEMPLSKTLFVLGVLLVVFANVSEVTVGRLTVRNGHLLWNWPLWNWELRRGRDDSESWLIVSCFEFSWKGK